MEDNLIKINPITREKIKDARLILCDAQLELTMFVELYKQLDDVVGQIEKILAENK